MDVENINDSGTNDNGDALNPLYKEKVHVAFLGWEIERIVRPVLEMRGNRLIILCFPKDKADAYLVEIRRQLEGNNIKVEVIQESLYKLVDLLAILNKIFQVETLKGNEIFINVSAGTKISACASTIAAMSKPNITAYYVYMKTYYPRDNPNFKLGNELQTLTEGYQDSVTLPECQISVPEEKYIKALNAISTLQDVSYDNPSLSRIYIKDLITRLKEKEVIKVKENKERRKETSSEYMAIKGIIEKLLEWKYITISPKKRNKYVEITEKGRNATKMYVNFDLRGDELKENKNKSIVQWIEYLGKREL